MYYITFHIPFMNLSQILMYFEKNMYSTPFTESLSDETLMHLCFNMFLC